MALSFLKTCITAEKLASTFDVKSDKVNGVVSISFVKGYFDGHPGVDRDHIRGLTNCCFVVCDNCGKLKHSTKGAKVRDHRPKCKRSEVCRPSQLS